MPILQVREQTRLISAATVVAPIDENGTVATHGAGVRCRKQACPTKSYAQ